MTIPASKDTIPSMAYVHPLSLPVSELDSLMAQAELDKDDFYLGLLRQSYQVYETANIRSLVVAAPDTLVLLAMVARGRNSIADFKEHARGLKFLARAWGLSKITTSSYDPRVLRLLRMVGAKVIGWHLALSAN